MTAESASTSPNGILMVAFHYPPCGVSSGIHRTLNFSRHLLDHGWHPTVLSVHARAYQRTWSHSLAKIPPEVRVVRAFALDSLRHLAVRGSGLGLTAVPDRWISWWLGAVPAGLRLIRKHRPRVLWSTYPIATAHLIGWTLHRLTGLPGIADFRDSMTEDEYPRDRLIRRTYLAIERRTVACATQLVFTAPSTRQMYLDRYPHLVPERCRVIANGYDEDDFSTLRWGRSPGETTAPPLRLLHAGLIYPEERDPRAFFRALAQLKREGRLDPSKVKIELRASGSEDYFTALLRDLGITDLVALLPALPYGEVLQACADADALLLFQGASCNHQIPAKVYEYLRVAKPILALTDHGGDTAALL